MKKLRIFTCLVICMLFMNCTPDETVDEQIYLQKIMNKKPGDSGEEGDQDLDKD